MLDLGWAELMFLAVLALVVVGPQDLPKLARMTGKLWGKAQRMYRDSLSQIRQLENEMDLAAKPDQRYQSSYYDLLPEHVRQAMEQSEPSRDPEQNKRVQAMYEEAMADITANQRATAASGDAEVSSEPADLSSANSSPTEPSTSTSTPTSTRVA